MIGFIISGLAGCAVGFVLAIVVIGVWSSRSHGNDIEE